MQTKFRLAVASVLLAIPTLVTFSTGCKQKANCNNVQGGQSVYICTGPKAFTYH